MKIHLLLLLFIAALLASALSSCSLLGYGLGSLLDNGAAHDTVAIFKDISSYTGQRACIHYTDSSTRYAIFSSYSDEPADDYRNAYEKYAAVQPISPVFGDSVVTILTENRDDQKFIVKHSDIFAGYYPEGILIGNDKMSFGKFDAIIAAKSISKTELKKLYETNSVPIRGTLYFRGSTNNFSLTNRDFQNVLIMPHSAPMRWIFLGIGAAIDITVISLSIYFANHPLFPQGRFFLSHHTGGTPQRIAWKFSF